MNCCWKTQLESDVDVVDVVVAEVEGEEVEVKGVMTEVVVVSKDDDELLLASDLVLLLASDSVLLLQEESVELGGS